MELKRLSLEKNTYSFAHLGVPPGCVGGTIAYEGDGGEVTLRLQPQHVARILSVVADAMVDTTRELANSLTRETIEHAGLALAAPVADAAEVL